MESVQFQVSLNSVEGGGGMQAMKAAIAATFRTGMMCPS